MPSESAAAILTIAKVFKTTANLVTVRSRTSKTEYDFEGLIQGGFTYYGTTGWSSSLDVSSDLNSLVNEWQAKAGIFRGPEVTKFMKNFGSTGIRSVHETVKSFKGSSNVSFSFNTILVAFDTSIDVLHLCTLLAGSCLPYKQGEFAYVNPLFYEPTFSGNEFSTINSGGLLDSKPAGAGTVTVGYSDIFLAPGMLLSAVDFTLSDVLTETGSPLYANVNFTVVPKAEPDMLQFRSYFRMSEKARVFEDQKPPLPVGYDVVTSTLDPLKKGTEVVVNGGLGSAESAVKNYVKPFGDFLKEKIGNTFRGGG